MQLSALVTTIILACSAILTVFFGYMGQLPMNPNKGPRMMPWRFLMLLMFTISLLLIVHLLTVLGLKTDPPMRY